MNSKTAVQIISCFTLISSEFIFESPYDFPEYGFPTYPRIKDLREKFIKNRRRKDESSRRIELIEKYLPNNTMYVDEIVHTEVDKKNPEWKKVNEIENEFRNLIAMRGLKYTYKRDTFWRTWRMVHYSKTDKLVCYRCENSVNFTENPNEGYWVIEDKPPPCPYELFSITTSNKICAVHMSKYKNVKNSCSSLINLSELTRACDNPVVTEWNIEKVFNSKVSERFPTVICGGRESCTFTTLYRIAEGYISFRIVNDTDDVIFSRIMKKGKNYACINECGKMNPYSKTVSTREKSLRVNLFGSKNKRENQLYKNKHKDLDGKIQHRYLNEHRQLFYPANRLRLNFSKTKMKKKKFQMYENFVTTTKSPTCNAIKLSLVQDELDEDNNS